MAATADACGQDIEVPEIMLNSTDRPPVAVVATGDHAARIFTPGPVISGCEEQDVNLALL